MPAAAAAIDPSANPLLAGTNPSALLLNVTATETLGPGYLQVYPTGAAGRAASSNLNIERAGQTCPTRPSATLGAGDQFTSTRWREPRGARHVAAGSASRSPGRAPALGERFR